MPVKDLRPFASLPADPFAANGGFFRSQKPQDFFSGATGGNAWQPSLEMHRDRRLKNINDNYLAFSGKSVIFYGETTESN